MKKIFYIKSFTGELVDIFTALDFLKYAKSSIEYSIDKKLVIGICKLYILFILIKRRDSMSNYYPPLTDVIPELLIYKGSLSEDGFWWPLTEDGMKERLKVVNELIDKYKNTEINQQTIF